MIFPEKEEETNITISQKDVFNESSTSQHDSQFFMK